MPKLYYTATSCGAASFIAAFTAGVKLETEQVDLKSHKTVSGVDYYTINPKGNVPALILDDGTILNENPAVLLYIADLVTIHGCHVVFLACHINLTEFLYNFRLLARLPLWMVSLHVLCC
jgi:hypothetical protein